MMQALDKSFKIKISKFDPSNSFNLSNLKNLQTNTFTITPNQSIYFVHSNEVYWCQPLNLTTSAEGGVIQPIFLQKPILYYFTYPLRKI